MHINGDVAGSVIVAISIFAHAWHTRIQAPPTVLSIIGWVVQGLAVIALLACWLRGG
jgi:hypothetical protein